MVTFDLCWPVADLQHTVWTFICSYHLQDTTKRKRSSVGWAILLIARRRLGLWSELMGLEEHPGEGCWVLAVCSCSLGICCWPWAEKRFWAGDFDFASYSYFYRETALLCWSCRHNSAPLLWFKSDVMCLLTEAVMAAQVEKRGGLPIIAAFLEITGIK